MSTDEMFEKFEDCANRALAHDQVMPLFERLETLETVADIGQVTRLLEPRLLPSETAAQLAGNSTTAASTSKHESHWVP